ncbi:putative hydrolase or acyltransferase (alpha/beta hydrolase superfamily) [Rubidibacter lacunae KORDI 51-2]|uniref:Putative hydrolase or acyltransferase (Alpha/beta hydrolase superfamily) n=1 Tax=Rubidibacter lacunae KORDI 51-2 TaxID=582515 RepID=U5DN24_9CHRO|nr:alpha/beta fold hydrolase [Rubidibacter lacunae]ERN42019.1 putative hydrolase or acyltransferase (alpha/beta hydrolase superfamily) [Rubidibacter lacunae KORDI 51-2]
MPDVTVEPSARDRWHQRIGNQRDWVWRGWQIRYSYWRSPCIGTDLGTQSSTNPSPNSSNPPLILLHGFGAAIEHWRHNIPVLAPTHSVYALDLLGFGCSRKAATEYSAAFWARLVRDFWATFVGQPTVLIGNSVGALVALNAAATYPEMTAGLVPISLPDVAGRAEMLPGWALPLVNAIEGAVASPALIKGLLRVLRQPAVIRRWAGVAYRDRAAVTDELVAILANPAADAGAGDTLVALSQSVRRPGFSRPVKDLLPQVRVPILLLWGSCDRMVPIAAAQTFLGLNPLLQFVELEDVGHCPHDEAPDRVHAVLLPWLADRVGGAIASLPTHRSQRPVIDRQSDRG